MRDGYIRVSQGFVCVYDITSRASFEEVAVVYDQIRRVKDDDNPAMVVVGNKCDLESQRQVAVAEGAALAQSLGGGCVFLETSAKEDMNVQECFFAAVREVRRLNNHNTDRISSTKNKKNNKNGGNSQRCYLS
jgi:GTPase KRas protein